MLRKLNEWSQEELAERLGVKRSSIAAYESKNVEPRLKVIIEMAQVFNVSIVELIEIDLGANNTFTKNPEIDKQSSLKYRSRISGQQVHETNGHSKPQEAVNPTLSSVTKNDSIGVSHQLSPVSVGGKVSMESVEARFSEIQKMIHGFQVFYQMKTEQPVDQDPRKVFSDMGNLLLVMEHIVDQSAQMLQLFKQNAEK